MGEGMSGSLPIRIVLPIAVHSVEAVKRAGYVLMHRAMLDIQASNDELICLLNPVSEGTDVVALERDFRREVLDQDLRISIEDRTAPYKNAILGLAFSQTGLQG